MTITRSNTNEKQPPGNQNIKHDKTTEQREKSVFWHFFNFAVHPNCNINNSCQMRRATSDGAKTKATTIKWRQKNKCCGDDDEGWRQSSTTLTGLF